MSSLSTVGHHAGYQIPTRIVNGTNVGSAATTVGMILWNDQAGATSPTIKHGRGGVTDCWAPADESVAGSLECGVFGVAMNAVAAGAAGLQVCVEGMEIPVLMKANGSETSLAAGAPMLIDPADSADDALKSRAGAVTVTGLGQPIRFKSSITQTVVAAATVQTFLADVSGIHPFGQFSGS